MIWRLQAIESKGFEGTGLGTLIMPYCSGFANLVFAYVMSREGGKGVKNKSTPKVPPRAQRLNQLELLFTLVALFLFTGTLWSLAKDGVLDFYDGLVLVGLFVFWQILHLFEILKNNVRKSRSFQWTILIDLMLIGVAAYRVVLRLCGTPRHRSELPGGRWAYLHSYVHWPVCVV